jgi:DNA-binding transcriptional MerR regulator
MKISELSRATGVPLPTVKFYLREGLLQPGVLSRPNQATYDERHIRRLRLIRALRETGGLGLGTIRDLCTAIDTRGLPLLELMGAVADAMGETTRSERPDDDAHAQASRDVDTFLEQHQLPVRHGSTARDNLVDALVAFRDAFGAVAVEAFEPYLNAMVPLAEVEARGGALASLAEPFDEHNAQEAIEYMVYGTVLAEPVLLSLRRLAHEAIAHHAAGRPVPRKPMSRE